MVWLQKTNSKKDRKNEDFLITCDCIDGLNCSQIRFSFFGNEKEKDIVYVSIIPQKYPIYGFFNRFKYAWNLLIYGKWIVYDEIILNKNTIKEWIFELGKIYNLMNNPHDF